MKEFSNIQINLMNVVCLFYGV